MMTRRETLVAAGAAVALLKTRAAVAEDATKGGMRVALGKHAPVPLPFDPKKLKGLCEQMMVSHHDNNYVGAVGGDWEEQFRATGASVGGGDGWAVLDFNCHSGDLRIYASSNHTQSVAYGVPLLVLDMYEHAYHIDFGAAAPKYIDAFFAN